MKIKIGIRHNLFYLIMLIVFNFLREMDSILIEKICEFGGGLLLTEIMFLSEFISGLLLYVYTSKILIKRNNYTLMGIKLIQGSTSIKQYDSHYKIFILMFIASFFDFTEFIITTILLPKHFENEINSLCIRLRSVLIIFSALFCYILLKFPIYRHQKFSLLIVSICFISIIILEYFFWADDILNVTSKLFLIILAKFFISLMNVIEKHLMEYDLINPFKLILIEGAFGLIFSCLSSIIINPFNVTYSNNYLILLIFLLIYFLLSGLKNIYKLLAIKLYSPMTKSLTDCFLDPFLIIYYYIFKDDFKKNGLYFSINLVISFIMIFCSCIYNEFLILFCCKLEYNTHSEITMRGKKLEEDNINNEDNDSDDEFEMK